MSTITRIAQTPQNFPGTQPKPTIQKSDTVTIPQPTVKPDQLNTTATKGNKATSVSLVDQTPLQNFVKGATHTGVLLFGGVIGAGVVGTLGNTAKVFTDPKALMIGGGVVLGFAATMGLINMAQGGAMGQPKTKTSQMPPSPKTAPTTPPKAPQKPVKASTGGKVENKPTHTPPQPPKTEKTDGESHVLAAVGAATGIAVGAIVGARTGSFNNFVYTASAITFVGLMLDKLAN